MPREGLPSFLSFSRFRFSLQVTSSMLLPQYKGAVFRGAFGNAFRHLVCVAAKANCLVCNIRKKCLYLALFEPPPPTCFADAAKFSQAPRPYVLAPPMTSRQVFKPGDLLTFEMVLIGPAVNALPHFIQVFKEIGSRGLGQKRGKYALLNVDILRNGDSFRIFDAANHTLTPCTPEMTAVSQPKDQDATAITLSFLAPLRLKEKGDLVTHLTFPLFFDRLVQRLRLLTEFYGEPSRLPDFYPFLARARNIAMPTSGLRWYDWGRYSTRQESAMKFGGLLGEIKFTGKLGPFLPYLRLGEQVHVGQATTFGLGKYKISC